MIFLIAPGKSIYSMVTTTEDGAPAVRQKVNGQTVYTLDEDVECLPHMDIGCYEPRLRDVTQNGYVLRSEWQRPETYEEGIRRYAVLAKAIASVAEEGEWRLQRGRLWRYLVTIAYHESGFRRDVHVGLGDAALGDCKWKVRNGRRSMVPGSCRSHGPFQMLFRNPRTTRMYGFEATDFLGDDFASSRRAALGAAKAIDQFYRYCRHRGPRPFDACMFASYGGVTSTRSRKITMRVKTLKKLASAPAKLDEYVAAIVGESDQAAAVSRLAASAGSE